MKSLIAGVVLIIVLGFAGFLYRNVMENTGTPQVAVCTRDAKVCPDGTSVGRTGPSCEFAPCPREMAFGTVPELYVTIPEGYVLNPSPSIEREQEGDQTTHRQFEKPSAGSVPHLIVLRSLGVDPEDQSLEDAEDNIVRDTIFSPSGLPATSVSEFEQIVVAGQMFYYVMIERFEGQVHTRYYLPIQIPSGGITLYSFDLIERDVADWMNPELVVSDLPEHRVFLKMLSSLRVGG
ncbi:MAG: hypothetical protein WBK28_04125 [Minisyncoccia bacterium]